MRYTRTPTTEAEPFEIHGLKIYMRVDHSDEDTTIQDLAQAAAAEIEQYCDLALLDQTITATTDQWPGSVIELPCGPLLEGAPVTVAVVELDGTFTPVLTGWWVEGGRYPRLHFTSIPGAPLRITYGAGYGADWASIPLLLRMAHADQVLRLYTRRGDEDSKLGIATTAARILARYRKVRA